MMILQVLLILVVVNVAVFLFKKISVPTVLAMISVGIVLGLNQFHQQLDPLTVDLVSKLSKVGLFLLMFIAGMEISWSMLVKERKEALFVAFFGLLVPFVFGTVSMFFLGYDFLTAVAIGIAVSITAEATKAKVLLGFGKINTRIGALMIGAGVLDDIIGITMFSVFAFLFLGGLGSQVGELFDLLIVFAAFFMGIATHVLFDRYRSILVFFERWVGILLVPFFFVEMGMHFEISSLYDSWFVLIVIILAGMGGKMLGVLFSKLFIKKVTFKKAYFMGWGMNSRGGVELALAYSGYRLGLLTSELYSAIIMMSFIATFIFPIMLSRLLKKDKRIMN